MKRAVSLILSIGVLLVISACNQTPNDNISSVIDNHAESPKILIAYFSRAGNTKTIAEHILVSTQGDLFEIKTSEPYPEDYSASLAQASEELSADFRPELSSHVRGMDDYEIVFIGYPIWYDDTSMAIRSFLEEHDLSGKTIIPFCTRQCLHKSGQTTQPNDNRS